MEDSNISKSTKIFINLVERDLAPTLLAIAFLISVGGYYAFALVLTFMALFTSGFLATSYRNEHHPGIKFSRILLFISTAIMFLIILGDNHIFEDSTLPQKIE